MDHDFWHQRWQDQQIGFHQSDVEPLLKTHWPALELPTGSTVFVPLCGKSLDMVWLANEGHKVIGCELSEIAVDGFFAGLGITPDERLEQGFTVKSSGPYEIWCGDFFRLPLAGMTDVVGIYDRAALVALPPEMRKRYAAKLNELAATRALLITLEYDQAMLPGPPHSVPPTEVEALFASSWQLTVASTAQTSKVSPKFIERGMETIGQTVYRMQRREAAA